MRRKQAGAGREGKALGCRGASAPRCLEPQWLRKLRRSDTRVERHARSTHNRMVKYAQSNSRRTPSTGAPCCSFYVLLHQRTLRMSLRSTRPPAVLGSRRAFRRETSFTRIKKPGARDSSPNAATQRSVRKEASASGKSNVKSQAWSEVRPSLKQGLRTGFGKASGEI